MARYRCIHPTGYRSADVSCEEGQVVESARDLTLTGRFELVEEKLTKSAVERALNEARDKPHGVKKK